MTTIFTQDYLTWFTGDQSPDQPGDILVSTATGYQVIISSDFQKVQNLKMWAYLPKQGF